MAMTNVTNVTNGCFISSLRGQEGERRRRVCIHKLLVRYGLLTGSYAIIEGVDWVKIWTCSIKILLPVKILVTKLVL